MLLLKHLPSIQASDRQLRLVRFQTAPPMALRVDMAENSMIETDKTICLYGSSDSGESKDLKYEAVQRSITSL